MLEIETGDIPSSSSAQPSLPAACAGDTTLVRSAASALEKFQKYIFFIIFLFLDNMLIFFRIGGDLLPSDESDEENNDSVTSRNPKGKLKFLLGPLDPRSRRRYVHAGRFFRVHNFSN